MSYVFDIVCLVVLVGCTCLGYRRGFFPELLDEIALVAGIVIAGLVHYSGLGLPSLWVKPGLIASIIQFILIMTSATIAIRLLAAKLNRVVDQPFLRPLNRLSGAVLALGKAWILIGEMVLLLVRFPVFPLGWMNRAILAPLMLFAGRTVTILLPEDFADSLRALMSSISGG